MLTSDRIKELAFEIGFDLCGISSAEIIQKAKLGFFDWLKSEYQAEMSYMAREPERRCDPSEVLPGAKSVIVVALNYFSPDEQSELSPGSGRISKYARGKDYHKVMEKKLKWFERMITAEADTQLSLRSMVDYGPFLERAYGAQAGLGYLGKNGLLINRQFGSYFFLAEIITTLTLAPDDPERENHGRCGNCQLCIEACPTGAIVAEGVIDSAKCISYLTIERPVEISENLHREISQCLFGCDICQAVCPHNGRATRTEHEEFLSAAGVGESLETARILSLQTREEFLKLTAGTALTRPKLEGLKRNAAIVAANWARKEGLKEG